MEDRTKIQLLIEQGFVKKVGEERLYPTRFTGPGISETFQLTSHGEKKYGTIKNAMEQVAENRDNCK